MHCISCHAQGSLLWQEGDYCAFQCPVCGLIWTQGPAPADLFDANYFINNYLFQEAVRIQHFQTMLRRADVTLQPPVLDVGAGVGFFLQALPPALRATAAAIEPATYARERLQQAQLVEQVAAQVEALPNTLGPFGTATLWDVLAGVPQPAELLAAIRERLRVGGLLIIKTPHHPARLFKIAQLLKPIQRGRGLVHVPAQWFHFTPGALERLLTHQGFQVDKMLWTTEPPLTYPSLGRRVKEQVMQGFLRLGAAHPSILCVAHRV